MKKAYIVLYLFCANSLAHDLSGCWELDNKSSSYEISLNENGLKISGSYCFINSNGNKIDCDKESSFIEGEVSDDSAVISFGGSGKGRLEYENGFLILHMLDAKPFDDFNMHIPNEIKLSKSEVCK